MKQVTRYQASDGAEFDTERKCLNYETIIKTINEIMKPLGKLPKDSGCNFANGDGYIPHDIAVVERMKGELVAYGKKVLQIRDNVGWELFGRYASDGDVHPLYNAWYRLSCVDEHGREWGQPYYALNPTRGQQVIYKDKK